MHVLLIHDNPNIFELILLRSRVPSDPRSCQMDGHTISTNIDSWFSRSCKRRSDTPSDGFVSHGQRDKSVGLLLGIAKTYLPLCVKVHIYRIRSSVSLFNNREIFWLVMMSLGGDRVIITLWAADRNRGRRRSC